MTNDRLISENVGAQVKALRLGRGLTVKQFVDECAKVGWRVTPATINNIEGARRTASNGELGPRREVSVDELLALAVVLGVHPVDLLVPGELDGDAPVPIPPDLEVPADDARAWIGGIGLLREPADFAEFGELTRWMSEHRRRVLAELWGPRFAREWTPEREVAANREHNLRDDAVDPDRIGGFWGQDGGYARSDGVTFSAEKVRELVELERQRRAERHKASEGDEAPGRG